MRLAAVCAIYGGYDLIPPVPEGVDDAVLVTDVPVRSGWRNVVEPSGVDPRLAAKRPKMRPDVYTDCDASLWLDGSVHVLDDRFVQLVRGLLEQHELVLWDHPEERDCLVQEARHCHERGCWPDEPFLEQASEYRRRGMPEHFGLWANTCVARRHSARMRALGDDWLREIEQWSVRDQVALPYLLWRDGIVPGTFGIDQLENDMVAWIPHAQDVYDHRRIVLNLESRIIRLKGDVAWLQKDAGEVRKELEALRSRRAVRAALRVARAFRPLVHFLRRVGRRVSAPHE